MSTQSQIFVNSRFAKRYKYTTIHLFFLFNLVWEGVKKIVSIKYDIVGDARFVQDSEVISSGIEELWPFKSLWLVSAAINYERQTGWCSQMKQNMFGCAAQPANDAGKQKDNCPLRWWGKSLSRNDTKRQRDTEQHKTYQQMQQECMCRHTHYTENWDAGGHDFHYLTHRSLCTFSPVKSVLTGRVSLGNW